MSETPAKIERKVRARSERILNSRLGTLHPGREMRSFVFVLFRFKQGVI